MAIDSLSIGEINSGPFNAIDSVIARLNTSAAGADVAGNVTVIADPSTATAEDVANKVNAVITSLVAAGLMEAP